LWGRKVFWGKGSNAWCHGHRPVVRRKGKMARGKGQRQADRPTASEREREENSFIVRSWTRKRKEWLNVESSGREGSTTNKQSRVGRNYDNECRGCPMTTAID